MVARIYVKSTFASGRTPCGPTKRVFRTALFLLTYMLGINDTLNEEVMAFGLRNLNLNSAEA